MALVTIHLPAHAFSKAQKQAMIEKVTDAMVAIEGESMRDITWVFIKEIKPGEWGIGGQPLDSNDINH